MTQQVHFGDFNLAGAKVKSSALSWQPWYALTQGEDCQTDCPAEGIVFDIVERLAVMYNFTWSHDRTVGGWGLQPDTGTFQAKRKYKQNGIPDC